MQVRTILVLSIAISATACTPRQPVVAPAPPPPSVQPAPDLEAATRRREATTHFEEGIAFGRQGRWSEAAEAYAQAASLDASESRYQVARAEALLQSGHEWEAADALQAAIRIDEAAVSPNHRVLAVDYERLIRLLTRLNRLDEARTARDRQDYHRRLRDTAPPR